jgi:hypothetical protein
MEIEDVIWFRDFKENFRGTITKEEQKQISSLHSKYFNHSYYVPCACKGNNTLKNWVMDLDKKIQDEYK